MGQPGNAGKTIVYVILPKWVEAYRHGVCCPLRGLPRSRRQGLRFVLGIMERGDKGPGGRARGVDTPRMNRAMAKFMHVRCSAVSRLPPRRDSRRGGNGERISDGSANVTCIRSSTTCVRVHAREGFPAVRRHCRRPHGRRTECRKAGNGV